MCDSKTVKGYFFSTEGEVAGYIPYCIYNFCFDKFKEISLAMKTN